jgi:hypothetical protein
VASVWVDLDRPYGRSEPSSSGRTPTALPVTRKALPT